MKPNNLQALSAALIRMVRPLVRILLRNGVSYGTFSDLTKWLFVDVARQEFGIKGRKQSISRISVITGLTRKEVKRLLELPEPQNRRDEETYNRAARVIAGWRRDRDFQNRQGKPSVLKIRGRGPSFSELVKRFSGDLPVRAVLDELLRVRAVKLIKEDRVRLLTRLYLPGDNEIMKYHILGTDVGYLIATIDHNMQTEYDAPFFQRKVSYNNLPDEAVSKFRNLSAESAQALLEKLDSWLAKNDRDTTPTVGGTGRNVAGTGIYYFEESFKE
jgi:hypothetical protein